MFFQKIYQSKRHWSQLFLSALLLAAMAASSIQIRPVYAATRFYVQPNGNDALNGFSWTNAITLQAALNRADAGDEIWVAAGTYRPTNTTNPADARSATFLLKNGVRIYGGFAGNETALSQRNWTTNITTLSGDINTPGNVADNSYHVVTMACLTNQNTRLDGFTITAGQADGANNLDGGGIRVIYAAANLGQYNCTSAAFSYGTLANLTITGNHAENEGGGMSSIRGHMRLENVDFVANSATNGGGLQDFEGSLVIIGGKFENNSTTSLVTGNGGGLFVTYETIPDVPSSYAGITFKGNHAGNGAGFFLKSTVPSLTDLTFTENHAGQAGGGLFVDAASSPTISGASFESNRADYQGGGAYNQGKYTRFVDVTFLGNTSFIGGGLSTQGVVAGEITTPTVVNAKFFGNRADNLGGAILVNYSSSPVFTNMIISGNVGANGGGGVYSVGPAVRPEFYNVTFSNNTVTNSGSSGGGAMIIAAGSIVTVANSILWGNTSTPIYFDTTVPYECWPDPTVPVSQCPERADLSYSIAQGGWTGTGNKNADPLFVNASGPDGTPGTEDDDLHLQRVASNPAIDAGDNSRVPALVTTDLDGAPRRNDMANVVDTGNGTPPIVDMGPYEAQAPSLTMTRTVGNTSCDEGGKMTFDITVQNSGQGSATGVSISNPLPGFLALSGTPTLTLITQGVPGTPVPAANPPTLVSNLTINPGVTAALHFEATCLDGPNQAPNIAQVTANELSAPWTDTVNLIVNNLPPVVTIRGPMITFADNQVVLEASFTDPGANDGPYTMRWDFGGGDTRITSMPSPGTDTQAVTYTTFGAKPITVTVTDKDGGVGTGHFIISVGTDFYYFPITVLGLK